MKVRCKIGEEMVRLRKERKLTQTDLAQACGVSQRMIAAVEAGERRPSPKLAQRIGAELGFSWVLFFEDGQGMMAAADEPAAG